MAWCTNDEYDTHISQWSKQSITAVTLVNTEFSLSGIRNQERSTISGPLGGKGTLTTVSRQEPPQDRFLFQFSKALGICGLARPMIIPPLILCIFQHSNGIIDDCMTIQRIASCFVFSSFSLIHVSSVNVRRAPSFWYSRILAAAP